MFDSHGNFLFLSKLELMEDCFLCLTPAVKSKLCHATKHLPELPEGRGVSTTIIIMIIIIIIIIIMITTIIIIIIFTCQVIFIYVSK